MIPFGVLQVYSLKAFVPTAIPYLLYIISLLFSVIIKVYNWSLILIEDYFIVLYHLSWLNVISELFLFNKVSRSEKLTNFGFLNPLILQIYLSLSVIPP